MHHCCCNFHRSLTSNRLICTISSASAVESGHKANRIIDPSGNQITGPLERAERAGSCPTCVPLRPILVRSAVNPCRTKGQSLCNPRSTPARFCRDLAAVPASWPFSVPLCLRVSVVGVGFPITAMSAIPAITAIASILLVDIRQELASNCRHSRGARSWANRSICYKAPWTF
jgi:hypothetical protein